MPDVPVITIKPDTDRWTIRRVLSLATPEPLPVMINDEDDEDLPPQFRRTTVRVTSIHVTYRGSGKVGADRVDTSVEVGGIGEDGYVATGLMQDTDVPSWMAEAVVNNSPNPAGTTWPIRYA